MSNVATDRAKTSVVIIFHIVSTGSIHKPKLVILLFLLRIPFSNCFCSVSAFLFVCCCLVFNPFCFFVLIFFFSFLQIRSSLIIQNSCPVS